MLNNAVGHHSLSNALKACNICTGYQIITQIVLLCSIYAQSVNTIHNATQLGIDFLTTDYPEVAMKLYGQKQE